MWSLSPDPDGQRIWVGTNDGLSLFEHGRFTEVLAGKALPHPNAYNLLAERDRIWIGTRARWSTHSRSWLPSTESTCALRASGAESMTW